MPSDIILNTKKKMYCGCSKRTKNIIHEINNINGSNEITNVNKSNRKEILLYVCIDLPYAVDTSELLEKILEFVNNSQSDYFVSEIQEIIVDMPAHIIFDVLQEGLDIFTRMTTQINLKNKNDIWFMYISSGCIRNIIKKSTLILLNQNPKHFECKYSINKRMIDLRKKIYYEEYQQQKIDEFFEKKLNDSYFIIKETINEVFKSELIPYENLDPIYKN